MSNIWTSRCAGAREGDRRPAHGNTCDSRRRNATGALAALDGGQKNIHETTRSHTKRHERCCMNFAPFRVVSCDFAGGRSVRERLAHCAETERAFPGSVLILKVTVTILAQCLSFTSLSRVLIGDIRATLYPTPVLLEVSHAG